MLMLCFEVFGRTPEKLDFQPVNIRKEVVKHAIREGGDFSVYLSPASVAALFFKETQET